MGRGGDKRNGGKGRPDRNGKAGGDAKKTVWNKPGKRQLADENSDFWKYLESRGFIKPQKTQKEKDRDEANRAGKVFQKFDRDGNDHVSLCEYENAMYRTEMMEKQMKQKGGEDKIVVVKDH